MCTQDLHRAVKSTGHYGGVDNMAYELKDEMGNVADEGINNNNNDDPIDNVKVADFDDVLPYVGEFGIYQMILLMLMAPFCFFLAFTYFSQVFITLVPDHWCLVPQLNGTGLTVEQM